MKTRQMGTRTLLLTAGLATALTTAGAIAGMHGGGGQGGGMHQNAPDATEGRMMGGSGMGGMMSRMMGGSGSGGMMAPCPMMQGGAAMGGMMPGMMGPMDLSGIDLTEDQQSRARELRHAHREEHYQRMARMMNLREDMHALMQSDSPDPDAVQELHGRMAAVHGEMLAENVRLRNAVRQMLTPEQRGALDKTPPQGAAPGSGGDDHAEHH
ncbi:Spy/CpxP family protein refolding chaperone [Natronocella acetinitrilica]|uniref:Spy/CpxP family protein refolding chaperone n=1 Tax=Natronocella acetinitrilica TaxID=414046 RepID=A0AAE3G2Y9_9GAMM|nr:Spy/CpxP family protein refolding chaperone [Natronocella acetinitrilica]MCP1674850.1 Spy/CpxP family protein refolding chaperone [Natronocella acetinitrilica]